MVRGAVGRFESDRQYSSHHGSLTRLELDFMITGFNTDVPYKGEVYHVQTEDKGKDNPMVESLIYKGGEILGARRTAYETFLTNGYDEKAIIKFMEEQHRRIIDEIKRGKFDKSGGGLLSDDTDVGDQSLDQVILNYLAANKKDK